MSGEKISLGSAEEPELNGEGKFEMSLSPEEMSEAVDDFEEVSEGEAEMSSEGEFESGSLEEEWREEFGGMSDERFEEEIGKVLREIETPIEKEGAGEVFEKLKGENLALRMVYALTAGEAWTPEEGRANLDEEGQRELGTRVLGAFYGKYGDAAEFRKAEREFLSMVKEVPEYRERIESGEMGEALDKLAFEMYGEQEEWMEVAEDARGEELRGEAEETEELLEVPEVSEETVREIEKATDGRVKAEIPEKSEKSSEIEVVSAGYGSYGEGKAARRMKLLGIYPEEAETQEQYRTLREMGLV